MTTTAQDPTWPTSTPPARPPGVGHRPTRPVGRQAGRLPRRRQGSPRGPTAPAGGRRTCPTPAATGVQGRAALPPKAPARGDPGLIPGLAPHAGRPVPPARLLRFDVVDHGGPERALIITSSDG